MTIIVWMLKHDELLDIIVEKKNVCFILSLSPVYNNNQKQLKQRPQISFFISKRVVVP